MWIVLSSVQQSRIYILVVRNGAFYWAHSNSVVQSLSVKLKNPILLITTLIIALHGAGLVSNFHKLTHHTSQLNTHSCESEQIPANEVPIDQEDDEDCHLCLTLQSFNLTINSPVLVPTHDCTTPIMRAPAFQLAPTLIVLTDRPARAPPVC